MRLSHSLIVPVATTRRAGLPILAIALLLAGLATVRGQEESAPARVTYDPTLTVQLQVPPTLRAGVPQTLLVTLAGTADREVEVALTIRSEGTAHSTAQSMLPAFSVSDDGVRPVSVSLDRVAGPATIRVEARSSRGIQRIETNVQILPPPLTTTIGTDKPLYQPGQTIHLRALAFDPLSMETARQREATLELRNPDGILVWRTQTTTDEYGVIAGTVALDSEAPTGTYEVRLSMPPNTASRRIAVRRYRLPAYRFGIDTERRWMLPGDRLEATITSTYVFGEPVRNAEIEAELVAFSPDGRSEGRTLFALSGTTDEDGEFFIGRRLPSAEELSDLLNETGQFPASLRIRATDPGGIMEQTSLPFEIAAQPLQVDLVPEGRILLPAVPNRIFAIVRYPDGTPAPSDITIEGREESIVADENGLASFSVTPGSADELLDREWVFQLVDDPGNRPTVRWRYEDQVRRGGPTIEVGRFLLSPTAAIVGTDETPQMRLRSTQTGEEGITVVRYLAEIRKLGTTVTIQPVDVLAAESPEGFALSLPEGLVGQIDVALHRVITSADGPSLQPNIATAGLYRSPNDALTVDIEPSRAEFEPGQDGEITFRVRRSSGTVSGPVVLGVDIVDTALFGLVPEERERLGLLLTVRRNIYDDQLAPRLADASVGLETRDRLMRVLHARYPAPVVFVQARNSETYARDVTQQRIDALADAIRDQIAYLRVGDRFIRDPSPLEWLRQHSDRTGITEDDLRDAWNQPIRFVVGYGENESAVVLLSVGPNGEAEVPGVGRSDDVVRYIAGAE